MQHPLQYPLTLNFKIAALAPQISVTDASGREILYVRQKLLKLRDKIHVFSDSSESQELYEINADRILDWSARFVFTDPQGRTVGAVQRQGTQSIWRATYDIQEASGRDLFRVQEEQPWLKVIDYFVEEVPFVSLFAGYLFSPTYGVQRLATGQTALRITKRRTMLSRTFTIDNLEGHLPEAEEVATVLGIMIMVLHERRRE
ncbi:MAG TPA: hypothetical protein VFR03_07435 [Thermoanaerobaculia bacterium]|nr:hypothetical protein [Thermoanaerobaculia bacterium]